MTDHSEASDKYRIVEVNDGALFGELRVLWSEAFGDDPSYVDGFYKAFGDEIKGYAAVDDAGCVAAALTLYPCGTFEGRSVYVSYAICTREDLRGQGIGSLLTASVRDIVTSSGAISLVSPAEPELEGFYAGLGYEPFFTVSEHAAMSPAFDDDEYEDFDEYDLDFGEDGEDGGEPFRPAVDVQRIDAAAYNRYREAFLAGRPHIELSPAMLGLIEAESEGLYSVNRGDAICAVSESGPLRTVLSEFVLNPVLEELSLGIDEEITAMLTEHFGSAEIYYRMPGPGRCQSMAAGAAWRDVGEALRGEGEDGEPAYDRSEPYFGFPID